MINEGSWNMDQRKALRDMVPPQSLKRGDVIEIGDVYGWAVPTRERQIAPVEEPDAIWMVVQSEHRQERTAGAELRKAGLHVFLPQYQEKVKRSNKWTKNNRGQKFEIVTRVLFPSYLFLRCGVEAGNWKRAFSCKGVRGMICSGDRPSPVPDRVVAKIMALPNCGVDQTSRLPFAVGQKVMVDDGPFASFEALVEEILDGHVDEGRAVKVLLDIFGRPCRITLSADALSRL